MAYCTINDVLNLLPPQIVRSYNDPDRFEKPITNSEIDWYINYTAEIIDSAISSLYVVPLKKIIITNADTLVETQQYPYPISEINSLLAASYIYKKLYSEDQNPQQLPKYSEDYQAQALRLLNSIINGSVLLKGQRMIGRRYLRPESINIHKIPIDNIKDLDK